MKVSELIKALSQVNGDPIVIMSKDREGNGFSPLSDIDDTVRYLARPTWSGELADETDMAGVPAVVLWPTN